MVVQINAERSNVIVFCICLKGKFYREFKWQRALLLCVLSSGPHVIYSRDFRPVAISRPLSVLTNYRRHGVCVRMTINMLNFGSNHFLVIHLSVKRRQVLTQCLTPSNLHQSTHTHTWCFWLFFRCELALVRKITRTNWQWNCRCFSISSRECNWLQQTRAVLFERAGFIHLKTGGT